MDSPLSSLFCLKAMNQRITESGSSCFPLGSQSNRQDPAVLLSLSQPRAGARTVHTVPCFGLDAEVLNSDLHMCIHSKPQIYWVTSKVPSFVFLKNVLQLSISFLSVEAILSACMSVHHVHACFLYKSLEGIRFLGSRFMDY